MHEPATEPEVRSAFEPPLDERGLPTRRWPPMPYDQALPALWLTRSLEYHRDREKLLWHIQYDDPVEYEDQAGEKKNLFPDIYVVCGMGQRPGGPLRVWLRPQQLPDVVFEFAVASALERALGDKLEVYRQLEIPEYFVFDVHQKGIRGAFEGYRLEGGEYEPIGRIPAPSREVRLRSRRLGLDFEVVPDATVPGGLTLRAFLPGEQDAIPLPVVAKAQAEQEEALREKDEVLREKDEEIARLRRVLEERGSDEAAGP